MKRLLILLIIFITSTALWAISTEIYSIGQRQLVDIWYNLGDLGGECVNVRFTPITDAGETLTCETFIAPSDTGEICAEGTDYHVVWDIGADVPDREFYNNGMRMRIQAMRPGVEPGLGCPCGPCVDIDGNSYTTVQIGEQCWMAENLKTTHYRDGTPIPNVTVDSLWEGLDSPETGAYCEHNNDPSNVATYGRLYNWYAVEDAHDLAPVGWHVPTDEEWQELERYLGMDSTEAAYEGWHGTNEGSKLAGRADLWYDGALESDAEFGTSGFTAVPGGYRIDIGHFDTMTIYATFWSSSEYSSTTAWTRCLHYYYTDVLRNYYYKRYGFSVRCVRD